MSASLAPFVPGLLLRAGKVGQWTTQWTTNGSFVFADISGFTRLSEQLAELGKAGAEELTLLLNATFEDLLGVARAEGGDLVKFGGDALFLFFEGEAHAERCCRAAYGMRAALKRRGAVVTGRGRVLLRISMGIHSGPFLFVLAGGAQRELFVLGEHATAVTDMEGAADAGEILVSPATAAQLPSSWLGDEKAGGVLLKRVAGAPDPALAAGDAEHRVDLAVLEPLVPRAIRRRLVDEEHGAEHRRTTVAFVHVGGVDALLQEQGADVVAAKLDHVVRVAVEAAERHEVTLLASDVAGGGIKLILTAGVPESVEDGEGRMLAVGRALLDADVGLPVRIGVNTGHVFAGEVGAPWRRVYTVMGDAVNLSARFMSKAAPDQMVAGRFTLDQSATPFETTALEPFMVKGKRHPQHAAVVGGRLEGRGRTSSASIGFIGRAEEMTQLANGLDAARRGAGNVAEILGEPGIGKSRLVHELLDRVDGVRVVRITCEPFTADRPYYMARILLRTGMGIALDTDADSAGEMLSDWLCEHSPDWLEHAPLLAVAIDAEVPSSPLVDEMGPEHRAAQLQEAAAAVLLEAFARPMLLVVEDAMWMDDASAGIVARSLRQVERTSWFGCFTTRTIESGLSSRLGFNSMVMRLQPLDGDLAISLAAALTDDANVPHDELVELCNRAGGNPLFLLELALARRDVGSLDAIPGSLEDLIGARIDRLSPTDRNLLRHAAVLGDRFTPRLFDRTLGDGFPSPVPWTRLQEFLSVDQGELRFSHDLVRRVAYAGLPFRRRRDLHLRIGTALVPRSGEPDDVRLGLLALHFDGSGDRRMAWTYNRMAGERARSNYANVEATGFLDRALRHARGAELVSEDELAAVYETLADTALPAGRFDLARDALRQARKRRQREPLLFARICRKEGKICERQGKHATAISWFRKGLAALEGLPEDGVPHLNSERGRLHNEWASVLMWRQRYSTAAEHLRMAQHFGSMSDDPRIEAHAYRLLSWASAEMGEDDPGRFSLLAQPIYESLGDFVGLGALFLDRGVDNLIAGNWADAIANYVEARAAYRRGGDVVLMSQAATNLAEILIEQGRYEDAESYLRDARRVYRASGFALGIGALHNALGRALVRSGRLDEGLELLRDALQRCTALDHGPYTAESAVRLAEGLMLAWRDDEALAVLDELADRAADGGPPVVALAARVRGTIAVRRGDIGAARTFFESVRELAGGGGAAWEVSLADLQLARLPGTPPAQRTELEGPALEHLARLQIDVDAVLPPVEPVAAGRAPA